MKYPSVPPLLLLSCYCCWRGKWRINVHAVFSVVDNVVETLHHQSVFTCYVILSLCMCPMFRYKRNSLIVSIYSEANFSSVSFVNVIRSIDQRCRCSCYSPGWSVKFRIWLISSLMWSLKHSLVYQGALGSQAVGSVLGQKPQSEYDQIWVRAHTTSGNNCTELSSLTSTVSKISLLAPISLNAIGTESGPSMLFPALNIKCNHLTWHQLTMNNLVFYFSCLIFVNT